MSLQTVTGPDSQTTYAISWEMIMIEGMDNVHGWECRCTHYICLNTHLFVYLASLIRNCDVRVWHSKQQVEVSHSLQLWKATFESWPSIIISFGAFQKQTELNVKPINERDAFIWMSIKHNISTLLSVILFVQSLRLSGILRSMPWTEASKSRITAKARC